MKRVLVLAAVSEAATGIAQLIVPSLVGIFLPLPLLIPHGANSESHARTEFGHELAQKVFMAADAARVAFAHILFLPALA